MSNEKIFALFLRDGDRLVCRVCHGAAPRHPKPAGVGYGEGRLTVSDNGRGITEANPKGSGLKLIAALARQIGGSVEQESSDRGTTTSLIFPVMT